MKFFLGYCFSMFLCVFSNANLADEKSFKAHFVLEGTSRDNALLEKNKHHTLLNAIDFTQIDYQALCSVATNTLAYLNTNSNDSFAVHGGNILNKDTNEVLLPFSSVKRIKESLTFICDTYHDDVKAGRAQRLSNIDFLLANFDFYRWYPDKKTANGIADKSTNARKSQMLKAIPQNQIFLTKYYTKLIEGSETRTQQYNQALYALPIDEKDLTKTQALNQKTALTRFKYTRQAIINGALLNEGLAKPLVWITEEALHDVLLQGTGVLKINDKVRYFNVHRNNGIAYDYALGKREQARYWYFAEVPSILGYGKNIANKIALKPHVSFAGNVKQLGLGHLFLVANVNESFNDTNKSSDPRYSFARLGVLADQGGAFDNNLFQLDLLVDSYKGWADYYQANKHLPDYNQAWLMLKKNK